MELIILLIEQGLLYMQNLSEPFICDYIYIITTYANDVHKKYAKIGAAKGFKERLYPICDIEFFDSVKNCLNCDYDLPLYDFTLDRFSNGYQHNNAIIPGKLVINRNDIINNKTVEQFCLENKQKLVEQEVPIIQKIGFDQFAINLFYAKTLKIFSAADL